MIKVPKLLADKWKKGTDFLGTELAIIGGAMSWISEHNLVAAISESGGFGTLAGGALSAKELREEIRKTKELTQKPFGVNIIVMHPEIEELIDTCLEEKVTHIVLAAGIPSVNIIKRIKDGGAKSIAFAPALVIAKKLVKNGIDAIIIEGMEAGGHVGAVSTMVLAQEILPHVKEVPVFVAGGIGRGEAIIASLVLGASGVQLGTRFVCAKESIVPENFKKLFIKASAREAIPSKQLDERFPIISVRGIENEANKKFIEKQKEVIEKFDKGILGREAAQLEIERFWAGSLRRAVIDGDVEMGSVMAGQSVGLVSKEQKTEEIMEELVAQATETLSLHSV